MSLQLVTPAVTEPVALAEAKTHLRVTFSSDDAYIAGLVTAAREFLELETRLQLMPATWREDFAEMPDKFNLRIRPVRSVSSIKYYDVSDVLQTVSPSNYYLVGNANPPYVVPGAAGWDWDLHAYRPEPIQVTYVAGYQDESAVPQILKRAILALVSLMYENRSPFDPATYYQEMPFGLRAILDQYASGALQ